MSNELQEHVFRVLESASLPAPSIDCLVAMWKGAVESGEASSSLDFVAWLDSCGLLEKKGRKAIEYYARGYVDIETACAALHVDRILELVDEATQQAAGNPTTVRPDLDPQEMRRRRDETLQPGSLVEGFRIVEEVEFGCHGVARLAFDESSRRFVIWKALEESASNWREQRAVHLEATEVRGFPILMRSGVEPFPYAVFDWAPGVSLEAFVGRFGSLRARTTLHIALEVTQALAVMSSSGLQHGAVCARNIHLLADSSIRILDWGLAGAPSAYRAPELAGQETSVASEIYSIGVLIFRLVMGFEPRRPRSQEEAHDVLGKMLKSGHSRKVVGVLERCLAYEPTARIQTHAELVLILGRLLHEQVEEVEEELGDLEDSTAGRDVRDEIEKGLDWLDEKDGGFPVTEDDEKRKKARSRRKVDVRPEDVSTDSTAFALDAMRDELSQSFRKTRKQKGAGRDASPDKQGDGA